MPENVATQDITKVEDTKTDTKSSNTTLLDTSKSTQNPDATKSSDQKPAEAPKPEEAKKAEEGKDSKKDDKAEGAPEKYDFKTPEGVKLDPESVTEFSSIAKELNLSNEKAQKFVDLATKHTEKVTTQIKEAQEQQWAKARENWVSEIKADKDVGGANFDQSREIALRAVSKFGVPGLKEVFDSGWGDHPALFRTFVNIGKALSEDRLIDGNEPVSQKSAAEILYPKSN